MVRGSINTDKLRDDATKIRDRVADQLEQAQAEVRKLRERYDAIGLRLDDARAKAVELEPVHAKNNAAVVALGGTAREVATLDDDTDEGE